MLVHHRLDWMASWRRSAVAAMTSKAVGEHVKSAEIWAARAMRIAPGCMMESRGG